MARPAWYETPAWAPDGQSLYVTYTELVMEGNVVKDRSWSWPGCPWGRTTAHRGPQRVISNGIPGWEAPGLRRHTDGRPGPAERRRRESGAAPDPARDDGRLRRHAFSPDGRRIVFSAIAPMAPVPVPTACGPARTTGSPAGPGHPSPRPRRPGARPADGRVRRRGRGGAPRRLTELGKTTRRAVWSPDGKETSSSWPGAGIYLMNADGSALTSIDQRGGHGKIDWRPGSK